MPSPDGHDKTAYQMYLLSAEQGNANAQIRIGEYYYTRMNDVVEYDPQAAMLWYRRVQSKDIPEANTC